MATVPPEELLESIEFDPPAVRVDEAAFAAKMLADRMLARLDTLGLCCARVIVEAETEHGERLTRCWRHEGALTPSTLVARVRWQLDAWLLTDTVTAGLVRLSLAPDDLGPATGRQLGFWGGDPAAADRAGRALARVQGMLGLDAVVTAVPAGGRTPVERVRWVPWGEGRDDVDRASAGAPGAVAGCGAGAGAGARLRSAGARRPGRRRRRAGHGLGPRRAVGPARRAAVRGAPGRRRSAGGVERALGPRPALVGHPPPACAVAGGGRTR